MDASGLISGSSPEGSVRAWRAGGQWVRDWLVGLTTCSALLLFAFSALIAVRRFWGGLQSAPGAWLLVAVGLLLAILASAVHYGSQSLFCKDSSVYRAVQGLLPLGLAISIFSLCIPGSSLWGVLIVLVIVGCEELFWLARPLREQAHLGSRNLVQPPSTPSTPSLEVKENVRPVADLFSDFPAEVIRRIERTRGPAGEDICWGQVRSEFQAEQRTASIHLAFCPPFDRTPTLHFEQIEGPDATVKATQVLPYGARLEIRLARSESTPFQTRIEFSAIVEAVDED